MSHIRMQSSCAAIAALVALSPVAAQSRSTVDAAALEAAVTHSASAAGGARARAAVTSALTSPRALSAAAGLGLSRQDVAARVDALDEAGIQQVADQVLAGGDQTIVISTTALLIALLLVLVLTRA